MKDFESGRWTLPNESNCGLIVIGILEAAEVLCYLQWDLMPLPRLFGPETYCWNNV